MAHEVTIDIYSRFHDESTDAAKDAAKSFENLEKAAEEAQKEIDEVGKSNVKPKVTVDADKAAEKLDKLDKKLDKLDKSSAEAKLTLRDRASALLEKVASKAKAFGNKTYTGLVKLRDSNVLSTLNKMSNGIKSLTSKAWSVAVKIKDTFTAPLTKLKNMLFNVRTLIAGIASAWAATKLVVDPINLADAYSSAKIGFSTILGESRGQQMMDELDEFAKATPFKTSGVIANAQKMMAMGWDTETIIDDMEVIGNAAAATGKMDQGLESIVRALSQIKTKGKLSTEELNQLAEAGIAAKAMLAEGLGYGTGDSGIAKMTKDLEDGKIASDKAITALLEGMKKYDGMMDSMANETVEGLWSQITDVFEINIFRKWGQGLQDGAKRGFGTVVQLLDEAEGALSEFGDMLYEIGKTASNWVADKFQGVVDKILEITDTFEFHNADLKGKISMLWKGLVSDPLKEWWENSGRDSFIEAGGKFGTWLGESITKGVEFLSGGILSLLGLDETGVGSDAGRIGREFWDNFTAAFDWESIKTNIAAAVSGIWDALPWQVKSLLGVYGAGKTAGLVSNVAGGLAKIIGTKATAGAGDVIVAGSGLRGFIGGNVTNAAGDVIGASGLIGAIGSTGNAMVSGTGILGKLASTGYGMVGGPASAGAYFGAGMSGGAAALLGTLPYLGGIAGGISAIKGGIDLYQGFTTEDETVAQAKKTSGAFALSGVGTGALIGSLILPGVGTAIGAGIGGIAGWLLGDKAADNVYETANSAKYKSKELQEAATAMQKGEKSAEEFTAVLEKKIWERARGIFGDIELSASEIAAMSQKIVLGDKVAAMDEFASAASQAEASLQNLKNSVSALDRLNWKAGLGLSLTDDEKESYVAAVDTFINNAKGYLESKQYEFTASVKLLMDTGDGSAGAGIISSNDAFYAGLQEQVAGYSTQLQELMSSALENNNLGDVIDITIDGENFTVDEASAIEMLQQKIADITNSINAAEEQAQLDMIEIKFKTSSISAESYENLQAGIDAYVETALGNLDEAQLSVLTGLNLQLDKAATEEDKAKIQEQINQVLESYGISVNEVHANVNDFVLDLAVERFSADDLLGEDALSQIGEVLSTALKDGIQPSELTKEDVTRILGLETLDTEAAAVLAGILNNLELPDGVTLKVGDVTLEGGTADKVQEAVAGSIPESVEDVVDLKLDGNPEVLKQLTSDELSTLFGIDEPFAETIWWKLKGTKTVEEQINLLASDFGLKGSYTFNPSVNINPSVTTNAKSFRLQLIENAAPNGQGYRGGIFGGDSAMDAFARGGMTDNSGIVGGSTRYIRVNEESPEMIIPLSSQRRKRALNLWNKTGEMLGVPGFAGGGIRNRIFGGSGMDTFALGGETDSSSSGSQSEGFSFREYEPAQAGGGQSVQIEVGGIQVEINVDAGSAENVGNAIKAQANEIAETLAGIFAEALGSQFENTPVRG